MPTQRIAVTPDSARVECGMEARHHCGLESQDSQDAANVRI
jgi:hypothetical protein